MYIQGDLAYEANYLGGLRILDIANIENGKLVEVAWLDTQPQIDSPYFGGLWSVYPFFDSGSIIMSDMSKGLIVAKLNEESISVVGDFDGDHSLGLSDLEMLEQATIDGSQDLQFDINNDGQVTGSDGLSWVRDLFGSTAGDSDLNSIFDSRDLVQVFQANQYNDALVANSTWAEGDWNGDGEFDSADLVVAFQDGMYKRSISAVPEPHSKLLLLALLTLAMCRKVPPQQNPFAV